MAFTDGIDVSNIAVDFITGSYVSSSYYLSPPAVFSNGYNVDNVAVDFATGNCIATGAGSVFTSGFNVDNVANDYGADYVAAPYLPSIFTAGVKIADYYSRLLAPGDTGIDISFNNRKRQLFSQMISTSKILKTSI
jgi:hypothetical protein